jgi:hypothetical protein
MSSFFMYFYQVDWSGSMSGILVFLSDISNKSKNWELIKILLNIVFN